MPPSSEKILHYRYSLLGRVPEDGQNIFSEINSSTRLQHSNRTQKATDDKMLFITDLKIFFKIL